MARRPAKKSNTISVDFSGVETLGRFQEDGDYPLKVVEVTQEDGDKYPYLNWCLECTGDPEGARVYNNTSLSPQSLWNVKAMLEAIGQEVPDDSMDIDLDELVGAELMGKIEMETYDGKPRPRLIDFWELEEKPKGKAGKATRGKAAAADDEDEKPARSKRGSKRAVEPAPVTEDDIGDMSQDELEDLIKEHDLDVDLDDFKTLRKMQAAVIDAAQEADILTDGDAEEPEEDDEKPTARRRRGAKPAADEEDEKPARRSRRAAAEEPEDEDEKPARRARRARR